MSPRRRRAAENSFYITTAIAYPNGVPHIGHAYEAIATDALARFQRLDGKDVFFLTGTDEHGLKMIQTAQAEKLTPWSRRRAMPRGSRRWTSVSTSRSTASSAPRRRSIIARARKSGSGWPATATSISTAMPAGIRCATRPITPRTKPSSARTRCAAARRARRSIGSRRRAISSGCRPIRTGCSRSMTTQPDFIGPDSRRNEVISFVKGGLQGSVDLAHHLRLGRQGARTIPSM